MKKNKLIPVLLLLAIFTVTPAYASYWTLTPDSQLDTDIGDEVAFTLTFHSTETIYMVGWDVNFQFDNTELAPIWEVTIPGIIENFKVDYNSFDTGFGSLYLDYGKIYGDDVYSLAAGTLGAPAIISPGEDYWFATFYMEVIADEPWDYISDVVLLSQLGTEAKGILDYFGVITQYEGDDGASVGSPVPIPGAVLLFGSSLLSVIGIRMNFRK